MSEASAHPRLRWRSPASSLFVRALTFPKHRQERSAPLPALSGPSSPDPARPGPTGPLSPP